MTYKPNSRRNFLKTISTSTILTTTTVPALATSLKNEETGENTNEYVEKKSRSIQENSMDIYDGPSSPHFYPVAFTGNRSHLIGTRADEKAYKRMRIVLESAHRALHNRMHAIGYDHIHTPTNDHLEHHK